MGVWFLGVVVGRRGGEARVEVVWLWLEGAAMGATAEEEEDERGGEDEEGEEDAETET